MPPVEKEPILTSGAVAAGEPEGATIASVLRRTSFAKSALPGARPMEDWERQDADDFFWLQFK